VSDAFLRTKLIASHSQHSSTYSLCYSSYSSYYLSNEIKSNQIKLEMRGKAKRIARPAYQCHPLASSSKTQTCCPLLNVDELTEHWKLLIDGWCTQLSRTNCRSTGMKATKFIWAVHWGYWTKAYQISIRPRRVINIHCDPSALRSSNSLWNAKAKNESGVSQFSPRSGYHSNVPWASYR